MACQERSLRESLAIVGLTESTEDPGWHAQEEDNREIQFAGHDAPHSPYTEAHLPTLPGPE